MKFLPICALLLLLLQSKPEKVALVFGPEPVRIEFIATGDAERLYAALEAKREAGTNTAEDDRLHAALTQALGTIDDPELRTFTRHDHERFRWMREAIQNPRRGN